MKLVPEWRSLWRSHSLWLQAAFGGFCYFVDKTIDATGQAWAALPPDLKSALPPGLVAGIGYTLFFGGIVAKFYVQQRLTDARKAAQQNSGPDS